MRKNPFFPAVLALFLCAQAPPVNAPAAAPPPAAASAATPDWMEYKNPYSGEQNDLSNPNRTTDEILSTAERLAVDSLTFSPLKLADNLQEAKKRFTQQGWIDYGTFLRESKLYDMVRLERYGIATIVNGNSMIMTKGAVAGAYRWLVDLPLMVTFIQKDAQGQEKSVNGGNFRLVVQIGRAKQGAGVDGLQIESWKMSQRDATD